MSDDGSSDQFSTDYDDTTMEIIVETLTGTTFEMTVSAADTIGSIKHKIQRVEGIPVSQQHLLYRLKELNNDDRLSDHGVSAGSTLRLVLSMRGGPISTRRLPSTEHHLAWRELKEYVDNTREDMIDKLPPGSKVTVLLFRDGENINLIRVIENEDGTCYPYSDTWPPTKSAAKESGHSSKYRERSSENHALMHKVTELRRKMEGLSMQKKGKKPASNSAVSSGAGEASTSRLPEAGLAEGRADAKYSRLLSDSGRIGKSLSEIYSDRLLLLEQRRNSRTNIGRSHRPHRADSTLSKSDDPLLSARNCTPSIAILEEEPEPTFNKKDPDFSPASSPISVASGEANTVVTMSQIPGGTSRNLLHHHVVLQEHTTTDHRPKTSPDKYEQDAEEFCNVLFNEATERSHNSSTTTATSNSGGGAVKLSVTNRRQSASSKTNLSRMQFASSSNSRIDSATLYNATRSNLLTSQFASTSKLNSAHLDNILGNRVTTTTETGEANESRRSPVYGRRARIERIRNNGTENAEKYGYSNLGYIANIEKIQNDAASPQYGRRSLNFVSNLESRNTCDPTSYELRPYKLPRRRCEPHEPQRRCDTHEPQQRQDVKKTVTMYSTNSGTNTASRSSSNGNNTASSSFQTLPAIVPKKQTRTRCALCNKRLNITTIHTCRCGGIFCSQHRYSEVHGCHYDYKTEGRKILEQANPLVAAPKLPKI